MNDDRKEKIGYLEDVHGTVRDVMLLLVRGLYGAQTDGWRQDAELMLGRLTAAEWKADDVRCALDRYIDYLAAEEVTS